MKLKKSILFISILILIFFSIIILKNMTKSFKIGNTVNSQTFVDNFLNLHSYKCKISVQIKSNKNQNKYIISQEYNTENGCIQEIIEPENIAGIKITKKDNTLKLENSNLNLQTIFENYKGIENNDLDLNTFIKEYKNTSNSDYEENDESIILKTNSNNHNKFLYIDKKSFLPSKLLVKDNNQNTTIFIEYNEIELN